MISRTLRSLSRRLRPRRPRPVILMYHRIATPRYDPWGLAVSPAHFDQHMAYVRQQRTPLPMPEFVALLRDRQLPPDAVAVTFDDGYRDNLVHGMPILQAHGVPATFFLPTACLNTEAPFWWDELVSIILADPRPREDPLLCAGHTVRLAWGEPEPADRLSSWRASNPPETARQAAYISLWQRLQRASAEERERVLSSLRQSCPEKIDRDSLPMGIGEVETMLRDPLLHIGAHTLTHPALTSLSPEACLHEVRESLLQCGVLAGTSGIGFAYPYGDVNAQVRQEVCNAGCPWACSTRHDFADTAAHPDLFALPRIAVPDVPLRSFTPLVSST